MSDTPETPTPRKSMPDCIRRTDESQADYAERKLVVYRQEIELLSEDVLHWKKQCKWACDNLDEAGRDLTAAHEQVRVLREALATAGIPLEALHTVECDERGVALSDEMKATIREAIPIIRAALAATEPKETSHE